MPFVPVDSIDPQRLKIARETLCSVFNIPSLHPFQEKVGLNVLQGKHTMLDVPTGGGKTLAFWFALFYYWQPGCTDEASNKIVLVIGPLVALLEAQAQLLNSKGIPAIAVTSNTPDLEQALTTKKLGQNQYHVGFLGPEMGLTPLFHEKVLNSIPFTKNIINLIIDEVHCISEWGTNDFRPEYRKIVELAVMIVTCPSSPVGLLFTLTGTTMEPLLPPELEHAIFTLAALLNWQTALPLMLVAQRVRAWVEPFLFRVVRLKESTHALAFLAKIRVNPDVCFHLQHLFLEDTIDGVLDEEIKLLIRRANIHNIGIIYPYAEPEYLQVLSELKIRQLTVNLGDGWSGETVGIGSEHMTSHSVTLRDFSSFAPISALPFLAPAPSPSSPTSFFCSFLHSSLASLGPLAAVGATLSPTGSLWVLALRSW
ncbi:p-loop containing nucleoside triphosphate hydrolase protein [Mycena indigotica]|uniref:DNA 3'-5' helicase n=1 Tax=Mycena indigotica TaxID=2126181 RepID=A0A8H6S1T7_9AGAR|nr:p-loop containing nucleoside triphosphate hydrolase protein [Mycena indigotica]KAF7289750.1 p-loop containing nucleoside triphosphate hydrolase protein [Mycena indigotica]